MTDESGATSAPGPALLALQSEDLHLDQLGYRRAHLPDRTELIELARRLDALGIDRAAVDVQRDALLERQEALEEEITEADERLRLLDQRSSSGEAASFRDQEA